jgi:hypothetical protein
MAYAALGLMYSSIGESALATENVTRAYDLRDRVSEKEKLFISAYYDGRVTGNTRRRRRGSAWRGRKSIHTR